MSKVTCSRCSGVFDDEPQPLRLRTVAEILAEPPTPLALQVAEDLRICAKIIQRSETQGTGELDRAAWRLADAILRLRQACDEQGYGRVQGLHYRTGLGAVLAPDLAIEGEG